MEQNKDQEFLDRLDKSMRENPIGKNREEDYESLMNLSDDALFNACNYSKYTLSICNDQFWRRRSELKLGAQTKPNNVSWTKPNNVSWRDYYLWQIRREVPKRKHNAYMLEAEELEKLYHDPEYLLTLDDKDLFNVCSAKKSINKLCNESFWLTRTEQRFPQLVKAKPSHMTWRAFYLSQFK